MRGNSVQRDLDEIKALALRYIKEETIQPIKEMGRFVLWGAVGSLLVGFGYFFLLFGALRFLQDQFKVLDGSLSWIPYLIVVVLAALVMALTVWRMRVDERFLNPAGIVQGGFLSAMMDSAMGASAVLSVKDRKVFVANTEMKSSFLRPARNGDVLTCTATVLKPGTVVAFLQARILDEQGNLVSTASSTYLIKERGE